MVERCGLSYRIYNKINRHSAIPTASVRSLCFYLETLFPGSIGLLIERKCPGNKVVYLVTVWKLSCGCSTSFIHNRKLKNRWEKKVKKKTKKKLRLHWHCHQSTPVVNSYTIIPSTGTDGGAKAVGTRFHRAVSLLIANWVDQNKLNSSW